MRNIRLINVNCDSDSILILDAIINGSRKKNIVLHEFDNYTGSVYVAENREGLIVGFVSVSQPLWNGILMIDHLSVLESHRRLGIGNDLVTFAIDKARALHERFLSVQTATWNTGAVSFYETMGFAKRTVLREYMGDDNDLIWLDIDLRTVSS